ncbi:MAG TPA: sigma-70 family RNA polymerase sigma factor, partial [Bacillaceae bacterium]
MNVEFNHEDEISKDLLLRNLMNCYGDDLKRLAYLYVRDYGQCEDIIQEVFISCYKHLDSFRKESSYKTWLIRITINKCRDYQRRWSFRNMIYKPIMETLIESKAHSAESIIV